MNLQLKAVKWILISLLFTACGAKDGEAPSQTTNSSDGLGLLAVNINKYAANKIICDPLNLPGTAAQKNYQKGIRAELFYRTKEMPRWYNSFDYINSAKKSDQNIFLSEINVPTRMFSEGFSTTQGQTLKDDQQNKLIEYFGIKMTTNIILAADDEAGYYEFALLSDDGATLKAKSNNIDGLGSTDEILINNEGDHPTKMGCSTTTVRMTKNVMMPVELTYYQGPRYHISNILMWRKSAVAGQDSLCNSLGNSLFFDPTQNSKPQPAFSALLARGWKILKSDNYLIGESNADYNPCVQAPSPIISDFVTGEVVLSSIKFAWQTNLPSTSQIQLTNLATGEVTITNSDNILRVQHEITLQNLRPETNYKAQALSVSGSLGREFGPEVYFKTQ